MIQAKNITTREDFLSPNDFKEKVNNFGNFKLLASAAYNNWNSLQDETSKIWSAFMGDLPGCYGWADKVHPEGVYVIQAFYRISGCGTRHVYYPCVETLMKDENAFQLMKRSGYDSYDKAMVAGLLLKNLSDYDRENEQLSNVTSIFKLMDME